MAGVKGQRSGGHNAKTKASHVLRGTFRGDRHDDSSIVVPISGAPEPPRPLTGEALAEWGRVTAHLSSTGAISKVDSAILYQYCRLHADAEMIQAKLDELESPFFDKFSMDGAGIEPKVHPGFARVESMRAKIRMFLVEFGLTPASRGRVKLPAKAAEKDRVKDRFFG